MWQRPPSIVHCQAHKLDGAKRGNQRAIRANQEHFRFAIAIHIGCALEESPRAVFYYGPAAGVQDEGMPLAIAAVIEEVEHDLRVAVTGDVHDGMRWDL